MSYQNMPLISVFLYPNCIFYMASSTQKQLKNFQTMRQDFGVWKMFTLRKVTDQQLFCSIQQNEHIKPVSCMEVPVLGTGGVIDAVVDSGIPELEGPHPHC